MKIFILSLLLVLSVFVPSYADEVELTSEEKDKIDLHCRTWHHEDRIRFRNCVYNQEQIQLNKKKSGEVENNIPAEKVPEGTDSEETE